MFTRKEHVEGNPYWIELTCSNCGKVETFGTTSEWKDGELSALISRMGWDNLHNLCSKCSKEHFD